MAEMEEPPLSRQSWTTMDAHRLISSLLDEIELAFGEPLLYQLPEVLDQSNFEIESKVRKDKLNAIFQRVIALPTFCKVLDTVLAMQESLLRFELQALDNEKNKRGLERLHKLLGKFEQKARKALNSIAQPVTQEEKEDRRLSMVRSHFSRSLSPPDGTASKGVCHSLKAYK